MEAVEAFVREFGVSDAAFVPAPADWVPLVPWASGLGLAVAWPGRMDAGRAAVRAGPEPFGPMAREGSQTIEILRPHGLGAAAGPRTGSRRQHTAFGWEALLTTPACWEITTANKKVAGNHP